MAKKIYYAFGYEPVGQFPLDVVASVNAKAAYSTRQLSSADLDAFRAFSSSSGTYQVFKGSNLSSLLSFAGGGNASATHLYDQSGNGMTATAASSSFYGGLVDAGVPKLLSGKQAIGLSSVAEPRFLTANDAPAIAHFSYMGGAAAYDMVFVCSESVVTASLGSCHIGTSPTNGPLWLITGGSNLTHYLYSAGSAIIQNLSVGSLAGTGLKIIRITQNASAGAAVDRSVINVNGTSYANNASTGSASGTISRTPGIFCYSNGGSGYGKGTSLFNEWYAFDGVMTPGEWAALEDNIQQYYS